MKEKSRAGDVIVSPACFRQRVNVPAAQVAGLADAELAAALAFEVEPFSGISRDAGEIAWRVREEGDASRRVFDVVQIRRADLETAVAEARAQRRCVSGVTAVPDTARGERPEDLPLIPVASRSALRAHPFMLWTAFCLLVACGLAAEGVALQGEVGRLRRDVVARRALQAEKESLESRAAGLGRETEELRRRRADAVRAQMRVAAGRAAGRVILEAVSGACSDEGVVNGVRAGEDPFEFGISGVALSAEAATRVVARLSDALAACGGGWTLKPGSVEVRAAGDASSFACSFLFEPREDAR